MPLARDDIRQALFGMNSQDQLPEGLVHSFYRAFWPLAEPDIMALFSTFCDGSLNFD